MTVFVDLKIRHFSRNAQRFADIRILFCNKYVTKTLSV